MLFRNSDRNKQTWLVAKPFKYGQVRKRMHSHVGAVKQQQWSSTFHCIIAEAKRLAADDSSRWERKFCFPNRPHLTFKLLRKRRLEHRIVNIMHCICNGFMYEFCNRCGASLSIYCAYVHMLIYYLLFNWIMRRLIEYGFTKHVGTYI